MKMLRHGNISHFAWSWKKMLKNSCEHKATRHRTVVHLEVQCTSPYFPKFHSYRKASENLRRIKAGISSSSRVTRLIASFLQPASFSIQKLFSLQHPRSRFSRLTANIFSDERRKITTLWSIEPLTFPESASTLVRLFFRSLFCFFFLRKLSGAKVHRLFGNVTR